MKTKIALLGAVATIATVAAAPAAEAHGYYYSPYYNPVPPIIGGILGGIATALTHPYYVPPYTAPYYTSAPIYADLTPAYDPAQVKFVQQALNYLIKANLEVDGVWGPVTSSAVATWQHNNGLPVTGRFDLPTLASITRVIGNQPPAPLPPPANIPPTEQAQ